MDIAWFRDLVICISGLVAIILFVFIAVLAYSFYRRSSSLMDSMHSICQRSNSILDSVEATTSTVRGIVCNVRDDLVSPVVQVMAIVQGVRQGIDMVNKFFKKKEEGGENG